MKTRNGAGERQAGGSTQRTDPWAAVFGESQEIEATKRRAALLAPSFEPLLIVGESGTGKELFASAIHLLSLQQSGPFVAVNGGAVTPSLSQSEILGHAAGAFTDARQDHCGWFERANGGTLFIDEVAELPREAQTTLLRLLEGSAVTRVGDEKGRNYLVRVISATNADLESAVAAGTFRRDLFYRLDAYRLEVPPLRVRAGDIELLSKRFAAMFANELDKFHLTLAPDALKLLEDYEWPGNVRQLKNVLRQAVVIARGTELRPQDFPSRLNTSPPVTRGSPKKPRGMPLLLALAEVRDQWISEALSENHGRVAGAARDLGVHERTIYLWLQRRDRPRKPAPTGNG